MPKLLQKIAKLLAKKDSKKPISKKISRRKLLIDTIELEYLLVQTKRRKKNIAFRLNSRAELELKAPFYTPIFKIEEIIYKNRKDIVQAQQKILAKTANQLNLYTDGSQLYFLGELLTLKIEKKEIKRPQIDLYDKKLVIKCTEHSPEYIKKTIFKWYREQGDIIFAQRLMQHLPNVAWADLQQKITVRKMRSCWGNCSSTGEIKLNLHLIKAPIAAIDYVILHELCHLKVQNHSAKFWSLLGTLMPDFQLHKQKLDAMTNLYIDN